MLHGNKVKGAAHSLVNLRQVGRILCGQDHCPHPIAQRGHGLFPQAADGQHPTPQGDLPGHGDSPLYGGPGQGRHHRHRDGDAGGRSVLGDRALREMDMQIPGLVKIGCNPQLLGPTADIGERRVSRFLHHVAQVSGELHLAGTRNHIDLHLK